MGVAVNVIGSGVAQGAPPFLQPVSAPSQSMVTWGGAGQLQGCCAGAARATTARKTAVTTIRRAIPGSVRKGAGVSTIGRRGDDALGRLGVAAHLHGAVAV